MLTWGAGGGGSWENGIWDQEYRRSNLVNTSWLVGSAGTVAFDAGSFGHFSLYRDSAPQQRT